MGSSALYEGFNEKRGIGIEPSPPFSGLGVIPPFYDFASRERTMD
jgi:hypothetical protein